MAVVLIPYQQLTRSYSMYPNTAYHFVLYLCKGYQNETMENSAITICYSASNVEISTPVLIALHPQLGQNNIKRIIGLAQQGKKRY